MCSSGIQITRVSRNESTAQQPECKLDADIITPPAPPMIQSDRQSYKITQQYLKPESKCQQYDKLIKTHI